MDDRHDPNLILGYVEDELTAADRARVDAMLADDPALASLVADLQRDRAALRGATPLEPPVGLADGAIAAIERQLLFEDAPTPAASPPPASAPASRFRLALLLTYGGIAAILALTVTVVFQSLLSDPSPSVTLVLENAPAQGMSLAEATLEAQRNAARSRQASADSPSDLAQPQKAAALNDEPNDDDHDRSAAGDMPFFENERWQLGQHGDTPAAPAAPAAANRRLAVRDLALENESKTESETEIPAMAPAENAGLASAFSHKDAEADALALLRHEPRLAIALTPTPAAVADRSHAADAPAPATAEAKTQRAPRLTLDVFTAAPDHTRQQLHDWAALQNLRFAHVQTSGDSPLPPAEPIRLTIHRAQVHGLVAALSGPTAAVRQRVAGAESSTAAPAVTPAKPWLNWATPAARAAVEIDVEVVIQAWSDTRLSPQRPLP